MRIAFLILLSGIFLLSGCRTMEIGPPAPLPLSIPESFSINTHGSEPIEKWWFFFKSDELNRLINDAIAHNFNLKILDTKIAQAKAAIEKKDASFFPDLGFSFGGQKNTTQIKKIHSKSSIREDGHSWDYSLTGSYVPDVWGEAEAESQARVSGLKAAILDVRTATLELTADIAETWIDILAARNRKNILSRQIKINKTLLALQKLRFANGKANALDVSQQREALAEAKSQAPLLEKQERLFLNRLAFLSGKTGVDTLLVTSHFLPEPVMLSSAGIPSDLLKNRPDIQAAKMRLSSAQWEITAARADFLPTFSLTAQALFSSGELDLLFHNWVAKLAASIAGPIFDGGFRKAEIKRLKAAAQEQLNFYAATVSGAIREVEDRLVSIQKQAAYIKLLEKELSVVRLTLKDAMVHYQHGQSSYLPYLTAWTRVQRLERQLVGERAIYIKDRIRLHRVLGWRITK